MNVVTKNKTSLICHCCSSQNETKFKLQLHDNTFRCFLWNYSSADLYQICKRKFIFKFSPQKPLIQLKLNWTETVSGRSTFYILWTVLFKSKWAKISSEAKCFCAVSTLWKTAFSKKMVAVAKNIIFIKWQWAVQHIFLFFMWWFLFNQCILFNQAYFDKKKFTSTSFSQKPLNQIISNWAEMIFLIGLLSKLCVTVWLSIQESCHY